MRALYVVACILLALAIILRILALHADARGSRALATATAEGQLADDGIRRTAAAHARTSDSVTLASCFLAFLGLALWTYSFARGYRRMHLIPGVLLLAYLALLLVLI